MVAEIEPGESTLNLEEDPPIGPDLRKLRKWASQQGNKQKERHDEKDDERDVVHVEGMYW